MITAILCALVGTLAGYLAAMQRSRRLEAEAIVGRERLATEKTAATKLLDETRANYEARLDDLRQAHERQLADEHADYAARLDDLRATHTRQRHYHRRQSLLPLPPPQNHQLPR